MTEENDNKVSFLAEPDVKKWIDGVEESERERVINSMLRKGFEDADDVLSLLSTRFTEKSCEVLHLAEHEARRFGHSQIGSEQLLVAMIALGSGIAFKALTSMGAELSEVRKQIKDIIGKGSGIVGQRIPLTPRAKRVLSLAWQEAKNLKHNYIGTEHLLLGLLVEGDGVAGRVLELTGIDQYELREKVLEEFKKTKS